MRRSALAGCALCLFAVLCGCGSDGVAARRNTPTRPIGEPLIFRLTGYQGSVINSLARYMIVFKLNRDPVKKITPPPEEGDSEIRGEFSIQGTALGAEGNATAFTGKNCFAGVHEVGLPSQPGPELKRLNRIPLGGRVSVELKPLTPSPATGEMVPGRSYVFHPKLRSARHLLSAGRINQRDRRQLETIGCG